MPLISVIVPVYRVEAYLARCLDSVRAQTYPHWECILVDDGSPDGSGEICDQYAKTDARFRVLHRTNGGLSAARNDGMRMASGEWYFFLDSDDWLHPDALALLFAAAQETESDVAMCDYVRVSEWQEAQPIAAPARELLSGEEALQRLYRPHRTKYVIATCKLWKRSLWEGFAFPEGRIHEDEATAPRLYWNATRVVRLDAQLYYYYFAPNSITTSPYTPRRLDYLTALEEHFDFFREKGREDIAQLTAQQYIRAGWEQGEQIRRTLQDASLAKEVEARVLAFCRARDLWVTYSQRAGLCGETSKWRLRAAKIRDLLHEEGAAGCLKYYWNKFKR